jgi:predicted esterase
VRVVGFLAVASACSLPPGLGGDEGDGPGNPSAARALFEVPRADAPPPSGFYALPFPNDIRVGDETGAIDLSDYPRPGALVELFVDTIADQQRGFGLTAAGFFRFDRPIDSASLPQSAPLSRIASSSVYLVDIDPDSPARGTRVPVRTQFRTDPGQAIGDNWLAVLPYPGFVLAERTTYALVATRRLLSVGGEPVEPAEEFAILAGDEVPEDPALSRAQAIYQPLWDWLDEPGEDEREDLIAAAVFTTQDATSLLGRVREVIWRDLTAPRPRSVVFRQLAGGFAWYDGLYDGPVFQSGRSPYLRPDDGGAILVDESGEPILQAMDELRFSLTVPDSGMPEDGWPIVIFAHGTGGDYHSFVRNGTAARLAAVGIACISIDQVLHGPRNTKAPPDVAFFNLQNPLAVRDNPLQGALDDFQLLRLVRNFDFVDRQEGRNRRIRFNSDKVFFFGHSQGSLTGVPFAAHEPLIQGSVFSGAGGLLYLSLLHKTQPLDIAGIVQTFLREDPLDEFNPMLALVQMYMDRADSASYGPLLVARPPDGRPKNVFLSEGLIDRYTPVPSIEALATSLQVHPVGPVYRDVVGLELMNRDVLTPPVTGNAGAATAVLLQYEENVGSDGHFVLFNVDWAQRQSIQFLSTLSQFGSATVVNVR